MTTAKPLPARATRFVFVLLPKFSLLPFAATLDALRVANRMAGRTLYTWTMIGEGVKDVSCSAGTTFHLEGDLQDLNRDDVIIVCGGLDVQDATSRRLVNWLRREARRGCPIGGICTGAFVLATAGLLDNRRATIHWENHDSFAEEFLEVDLTKSVYVIDGNRYTSAGGTASIDLMLKLIARQAQANLPADGAVSNGVGK